MREPDDILLRGARVVVTWAVCSVVLAVIGCDDGHAGSGPSDAPGAERRAEAGPVGMVLSDWASFRGDLALTGVAEARIPDEPVLLWSHATGGAIVSSPVVKDGRVYVGSDDGGLYCLDVHTGERLWVFETELLIEAPPLVHAGGVYVGSHDFWFYAVDAASGALRWKVEAGEKIVGGATVATGPGGRDLIVFGSHDALVYAIDAGTGETVWTFPTADRVNATLAVEDNKIMFGGCDTAVYVVDGATGRELSKIVLGGECHIAASAGVKGGRIYFGHHANEFIAIDLEASEVVWRYTSPRFGFFSPPAITDDRVFFGGRDRKLHCVDRASGAPVWAFETRRKIDAGPVVAGDKVVVGSGDGRLYLVSRETGEQVWSSDIGKSIFSSPAVVATDAGGMFLVGANDGLLYAFGPESLGALSSAPPTAQATEANDG